MRLASEYDILEQKEKAKAGSATEYAKTAEAELMLYCKIYETDIANIQAKIDKLNNPDSTDAEIKSAERTMKQYIQNDLTKTTKSCHQKMQLFLGSQELFDARDDQREVNT